MPTTQVYRPLEMAVESLGADDLLITEFSGREAISELFEFQVRCVSEQPDRIQLDRLLGKNVTLAVRLPDDSPRFWNGIISRGRVLGRNTGPESRFTKYQLEIVPWTWLLTRTQNSRIFQDMTVPDIVKQVFTRHGLTDFQEKLSRSYTKLDYCVQYRESDAQFVQRIMAGEGIFYYFDCQNGKHMLVMSDSPQVHQNCVFQHEVKYDPKGGIDEQYGTVETWAEEQRLRSGKFTLWDHNRQMPSENLESNCPTKFEVGGNDRLEIYDYPGTYGHRFNKPDERLEKVNGEGESLVKLRMEAEEAQYLVVNGSSNCAQFAAGRQFALLSPPPGVTAGPFVLTGVEHAATQAGYDSDEGEYHYSNQFTCMPLKTVFRPPLLPRPLVSGAQTARVVGPPGEEIYPDKYGRVKVQFHWDREGKNNENSSCWVEVSQIHAGKGFGAISIPRIGEEVVVDFLEGDPEQPLIVGRIYHAENMPPFALPGEKTRSGMKSNTHKGAGFNEITMDDTAGKEQIRVHGQYNMDTRVNNDETHSIGMNRKADVGVDETMLVGNNQDLTVGVNKSVSVGSNHTETVGVNQSVSVGSNQSNNVGMMKNETVGMMSNEMVGIMKTTNVGAVYSIISGAAMNTAVGFVSAEEVGMNKTLIVGSSLKISAGSKIEIACGASKITMDAGGKVTISGTEFNFSASGAVKINGAIIDLN